MSVPPPAYLPDLVPVDTARPDDAHLLRDYVERGSPTAFAELVRRHAHLVYAVALRHSGRPHAAEEIAQSVFIELARQAYRLRPGTILAAWLHTVTRRRAIDAGRAEIRRRQRETAAWDGTDGAALAPPGPSNDAERIAPLLDAAVASLPAPDRAAVLLRFFQHKSLAEIGATLGISEDAAQKRVARALDTLRAFFARRGVATTGAAGCAAALTAHAAVLAPPSLITSVAATALSPSALSAAGLGAATLLTMTLLQKSLLTALLLTSLGVTVYQHQHAARLEREVAAERTARSAEHSAAAARLAALQAQLAALESAAADRTRDETQARTEEAAIAQEPAVSATVAWMERMELLKTLIKARPEAAIPELQFLRDEDWLSAARQPLETEGDVRRALAQLRSLAENGFTLMALNAMRKFTQTHGPKIPDDILELLPFFHPPITPDIIERWRLKRPGEKNSTPTVDSSSWAITTGSRADAEMDGALTIHADGSRASSGWMSFPKALNPVLERFVKAQDSLAIKSDSFTEANLLPYTRTPEERAALQAHFGPIQLPPPQP